MYLFDYATELVTRYVVDEHMRQITDFFELFEYAASRKCALLRISPFVMDFLTRAYYSKEEEVSGGVAKRVTDATALTLDVYFKNIDYSKFKSDVDPMQIYMMLLWLGDGYLHNRQRTGLPLDMDDLMVKFETWITLFKKIAYKEEFLK